MLFRFPGRFGQQCANHAAQDAATTQWDRGRLAKRPAFGRKAVSTGATDQERGGETFEESSFFFLDSMSESGELRCQYCKNWDFTVGYISYQLQSFQFSGQNSFFMKI